MPKRLIFTCHRPLAGQELIETFLEEWYGVYGVYAFSPATAWPEADSGGLNHTVLDRQVAGLTCCVVDHLRVPQLAELLSKLETSAIVHAPLLGLPPAASPVEVYGTVVNSTLAWLEAARQACPMVPFIFLSSSQVYGDRANTISMEDKANRWDFLDPYYAEGLIESFPIEGSTHSLLGAAAVAADVLVQEYARSYYMPTCCLRIDSLCDPGNGSQDRRDLLSQVAYACLTGTDYPIHGDLASQVREILSARDLARLIEAIILKPSPPGEIYNVGGGKPTTCSVHEAIEWIESLAGKKVRRTVSHSDAAFLGETRCHHSHPYHLRQHYPEWQPTDSWKDLARRVVEVQSVRPKAV